MKFSVKKERLASTGDRTFSRAVRKSGNSLLQVIGACEIRQISQLSDLNAKSISFTQFSLSSPLTQYCLLTQLSFFIIEVGSQRTNKYPDRPLGQSFISFSHPTHTLGDFLNKGMQKFCVAFPLLSSIQCKILQKCACWLIYLPISVLVLDP